MSDRTLHTLNRGPQSLSLFGSMRDAISPRDSLLLIEDGVYWATAAYAEMLAGLNCDKIYQLAADADARGIQSDRIEPVDDAGFVSLTVSHQRTLSWF